ncbi:MAG: hypothetical protein HY670_02465 [Chloroflexi bacterium]|nr:hypothetical protein [Chloroflexota bacterium]
MADKEMQQAMPGAKKKRSKKDLIFKILMFGWPVILIAILAIIILISSLTAK